MTTPTPKVPLPEPEYFVGPFYSEFGGKKPAFSEAQLIAYGDARASEARRGGGSGEWFPLLGTPLALRWSMLDEASAQRAHGQSLARLAERGGLSPAEAAAVVEKRAFRSMDARGAFDALLAAAPPSPEGAEGVDLDYVLPCHVKLPPATTVRKGCKLRTLLMAIRSRELWVGPLEFTGEGIRVTFNPPTPPPPVAHSGEVTEAMVERAARALYITDDCHHAALCESWDTLPDYGRDRYRDKARAAITAALTSRQEPEG